MPEPPPRYFRCCAAARRRHFSPPCLFSFSFAMKRPMPARWRQRKMCYGWPAEPPSILASASGSMRQPSHAYVPSRHDGRAGRLSAPLRLQKADDHDAYFTLAIGAAISGMRRHAGYRPRIVPRWSMGIFFAMPFAHGRAMPKPPRDKSAARSLLLARHVIWRSASPPAISTTSPALSPQRRPFPGRPGPPNICARRRRRHATPTRQPSSPF